MMMMMMMTTLLLLFWAASATLTSQVCMNTMTLLLAVENL